MIFGNPEFQRNIWLRFSPWRLMVLPGLLLLTLAAFAVIADHWWRGLPALLEPLIYIALFLWGIYEAAKAPTEELREKTWDFQKMSSLGPWQLTLGKFFGATSYVWYFGLLLIVANCIAQYQAATSPGIFGGKMDFSPVSNPQDGTAGAILFSTLIMIMSALVGQATAFFTGLFNLKQNRFSVIRPFIAGFIVGNLVNSSNSFREVTAAMGKAPEMTHWYGIPVAQDVFLFCSLAFILAWLMVGNQRLMRIEIGFRARPVAWGLFVASFALYLAGAAGGSPFRADQAMFMAFIFALACAYIVMLTEADNLTGYRKFLYGLKNNNTRQWQENLPKWAVAGAVTLATIPLLFVSFAAEDNAGRILLVATGLCLFACRDGLVIHGVLLKPGNRYGHFTIGVYLLLVYMLLPLLIVGHHGGEMFSELGNLKEAADGLQLRAAFFYPAITTDAPGYILPVLAEIALAFVWMKSRIARITARQADQPKQETAA